MREGAEHPANRVAQLAIIVADRFQDFGADALIVGVVDAGHPQTQDVGARNADDVLREGLVAERLRHFAAALIEREAVGQHDVKRRATARAAAFQKRGLKPAAMLVRAFEIHDRVFAAVDRPPDAGQSRKVLGVLEDEGVRRARIEPDFDQVVDLVISRGVVLRPEEPLLRAFSEPCVGAFPLVGVGDPRVHLVVEQDFVTVLADEDR